MILKRCEVFFTNRFLFFSFLTFWGWFLYWNWYRTSTVSRPSDFVGTYFSSCLLCIALAAFLGTFARHRSRNLSFSWLCELWLRVLFFFLVKLFYVYLHKSTYLLTLMFYFHPWLTGHLRFRCRFLGTKWILNLFFVFLFMIVTTFMLW